MMVDSFTGKRSNKMDERTGKFDLNSPKFDADAYVNALLKDCTLPQLMDKEKQIFREIQGLDSEMQTLVYENYNKFISATETIRKMKIDFKEMEEEMEDLVQNMESITELSDGITKAFAVRKGRVQQLCATHATLNQLQLIFDLPKNLNQLAQEQEYELAASSYLQAVNVLEAYKDIPTFGDILRETEEVMEQVKDALKAAFQDSEASAITLRRSVDVLLQLGAGSLELCEDYLTHSTAPLETLVNALVNDELKDVNGVGFSEFVDWSCNEFLSNLCLLVATFTDLFISPLKTSGKTSDMDEAQSAQSQLLIRTSSLMDRYLDVAERRARAEAEQQDGKSGNSGPSAQAVSLVKGLDKLNRRMTGLSQLLPGTDFGRTSMELITRVSLYQCAVLLQRLLREWEAELVPTVVSETGDEGTTLNDVLAHSIASLGQRIRDALAVLQLFASSENTFCASPKFLSTLSREGVREGVIVAFFSAISESAVGLTAAASPFAQAARPSAFLLLARLFLDLHKSIVHHFLTLTEEQFRVKDKRSLTPLANLTDQVKEAAQVFLDAYVQRIGMDMTQMIRQSTDSEDWLSCDEPRGPRSLIKRIVEDIGAMEVSLGHLLEEGQRKDRSSDSSRRSHKVGGRGMVGDTSSYLINRLFSERIEIYWPVKFTRTSVLTGVVKITLKAFAECVRLQTFSTHGFQQIQVDAHYLYVHLWRFVADENTLTMLIDEVISGAYHRSLEPIAMDSAVVEALCNKPPSS
ncbi:unnamed protein product [Cyprideis torosa]|uniref:Vacuolar protein sorting-associated protein 51 homolog n=1 Tax=Cyprideis torosa TaxID=163714 RepID=A0A7R8WEK9_9CRUS|nr:unnamed protein product [Cyprideis torosa]CAG0889612.1 unnamed protein product [Cyprideis torosa]